MVILIIILLVVFLLLVLRLIISAVLSRRIEKSREIIYNDNILINYYCKQVIVSDEDVKSLRFNLYDKNIKDEKRYKENIIEIANDIYNCDKIGDKYAIILLAKFLVKYYTEPIISFGNKREKKMLRNMVMLLVANGFIAECDNNDYRMSKHFLVFRNSIINIPSTRYRRFGTVPSII